MRPIRKSPESTPHQYSAAYEWTDKDGGKHTGYWSQLCSGANQALLHFHNFVQHNQESDAERKVVRPKLRFDQYRIKTLEVVFRGEHRDERGVEFRQAVDVPSGAYPDLRKQKFTPPPPTEQFPFMADMPKGAMPAEHAIIGDQS